MILSQIWYINELVGYTYLLWSKICTLPHVFLLRFAWWRRRRRLWTKRSTGVLWSIWWIATPLRWNMRWLRPHDFKKENARENINFSTMLLQLQRYTVLHYMGTRSCTAIRQTLKAGQSWPILRYYAWQNQSFSQYSR